MTGARNRMFLPFLLRFPPVRVAVPLDVVLVMAVIGPVVLGLLIAGAVLTGDMLALPACVMLACAPMFWVTLRPSQLRFAAAISLWAAILVTSLLATGGYLFAFAMGLLMAVFVRPTAIRARRQGGKDGPIR